MANGTMKWFEAHKSFGTIAVDKGGQDVLVHYSPPEMGGCKGLKESQHAVFEVGEAAKGPQADAVKLA
ncbi:MAG: cold shock domain-containing protein [Salinibacterium sp.]|nr:cold shock domain-containing protein [Salinibacterium sp.]